MSPPIAIPSCDPALNREITEMGLEVFAHIGKEQPSSYSKNFWISKIMEWSMTRPDFKVSMFRLVDVLPSLRSAPSISRHVNEYLGPVAGEIHSLLKWGTSINPHSLTASATSVLVKRGVKEMAGLFIAGETPQKATSVLQRIRRLGLAFTVDLLGEFSVSEKEALIYLDRYLEAIEILGQSAKKKQFGSPILSQHPGEKSPICISVKLTALYSQCSALNFNRSVAILSDRLTTIVRAAHASGAQVYVDAEDTGNNPIIFETFKQVFGGSCKDVAYPGIVIQAYTKSSRATVLDFIEHAKKRGSPIAVRLVKGAYWDYETVLCAQNGWEVPVYTRKSHSDANYEELSRLLLDNVAHCLPAFGSHNIRSLTHACCYARKKGITPDQYELQMLYGMAEPIAKTFAKRGNLVRLYVPLGNMFVGMGYLVRRLLENTSNESFLKHTFFDAHQVNDLLRDPGMER